MTCKVKECGNYWAKIKKIGENSVKYYSFLKDSGLFNKWRRACEKENINIKSARICSKHFSDECFLTKPLQQQLLGYSPSRIRKLRPNAISTLHLQAVSPPASNKGSPAVQEAFDEVMAPSTSKESSSAVQEAFDEVMFPSTSNEDLMDVKETQASNTEAIMSSKIRHLEFELAALKEKINKSEKMRPKEDKELVKRKMHEFTKYHGCNLNKENFIFKKLANIIESKLQIKIPKEALLCLIRTRTFIRVREMNRAIAAQNHRQKQKKLSKFTNKKPTIS